MKSWSDIGFEIEITADGSPTLRLLQSKYPDAAHGESMHHSGGACAETLLIYGSPIKEILRKTSRSRFVIVGLGLGYIEMTIAREALLQEKKSSDIGLITSFESVPELREFFVSWLWGRFLAPQVAAVYDQVAAHLTRGTNLEISSLKDFLRPHFKKADQIQGALDHDFSTQERYHGILYDAFSSKTSPHLWEESFLLRFLQEFPDPKFSQFSTYACRASLKNALAQAGFQVIVRPGFQGKRNSTLGCLHG